jgi:hypothetical protein
MWRACFGRGVGPVVRQTTKLMRKNIGCGRLKILSKGRNSGNIMEILKQNVRQRVVFGALNVQGLPTVAVGGTFRER